MSSRLSKSSSSCKRIYIGNLPQDIKKGDIEDLFHSYGPIDSVDIHNRDDPAFAFVEFEDSRDAEDAIREKDGERYRGDRLRVQVPLSEQDRGARRGGGGYGGYGGGSRDFRDRPRGGGYTRGRGRGPPIKHSDYRCLVSGLPPTGSWQDLKDHMREAGEVLCADVYKDGTGMVEFANRKDMEWAAKYLDDSKFRSHENESSHIRVKQDGAASSRRSRSRSRSNSRRRSPSRSRTRSRSPRRSRSPSRSRSRSPARRYSRSRSR